MKIDNVICLMSSDFIDIDDVDNDNNKDCWAIRRLSIDDLAKLEKRRK